MQFWNFLKLFLIDLLNISSFVSNPQVVKLKEMVDLVHLKDQTTVL